MNKYRLFLMVIALLTFGQTAWTQNTQNIHFDESAIGGFMVLDENVDIVNVSANLVGSLNNITLSASEGCIMHIHGSGVLGYYSTTWYYDGNILSWNSNMANTNYDYWVYTNEITLDNMMGDPEWNNTLAFEFTIDVYYADRIASEDILWHYVNHSEPQVRNGLGLGADITLNERLKIGLYDNLPVGIDLNGHVLQRSGLSSPDANGHVIEVCENDSLTLMNGTLSGGYADNGGGICNNGTLLVDAVTITNCQAGNGGAVMNHGVANINDCTFSSNSVTTNGGAIWNDSTLTISGGSFTDNSANEGGAFFITPNATLKIDGGSIMGNTSVANGGAIAGNGSIYLEGNLQVKENLPDNIYLRAGHVLYIEEPITSGENSIGINMEKTGVFTFGYYSSGTTTNPFFAYGINGTTVIDGECSWIYGYYECSWDETTQKVIHTRKLLNNPFHNLCDTAFINHVYDHDTHGNLPAGWYIVEGEIDIDTNYLECAAEGSGDVHIILCDNSSIKMNHLNVVAPTGKWRTLSIYCQSYGDKMGKLTAINNRDRFSAAIGGLHGNYAGPINIHGGDIHAENTCSSQSMQDSGAGIGSAYGNAGHSIKIYDGKIYAKGGGRAAGIGGGHTTTVFEIIIYGGDITAIGGKGGAGIGTGHHSAGELPQLLICGGTINATGGRADPDATNETSIENGASPGAGLGTGGDTDGRNNEGRFNITINGGNVTAIGGQGDDGFWGENDQHSAAGIGTGGDCYRMKPETVHITINGGEVYAKGGDFYNESDMDGAGIGGGYGCPGAQVVITGGIVTAVAGDSNASAIGAGDNCDSNGTITLPSHYSVKAGANNESLTPSLFDERDYSCWNNLYAIIEPCDHSNGNWQDTHSQDLICNVCPNCVLPETIYKPYTFLTSGSWNTNTNWFYNYIPNNPDAEVVVQAAATIPSSCIGLVNTIEIQENGSITIEDGGQLIHNNEGVVATVHRHIGGYGTNDGGYCLITNPVMTDQNPDTLGMTTNDYDLYRFDQSQDQEWQNYKQETFSLENGVGYLYANSSDTDIEFHGELNPADNDIAIDLVYNSSAVFAGFNLVGNPFVCTAYVDKPFYRMNDDGNEIVSGTNNSVEAREGIFAIATETGETLTFTTEEPTNNDKRLTLNLSQDHSTIDRAIICFNKGYQLPKFQLRDNSTKIYIPQDGKDYAVVNADNVGELTINFKAEKDGSYILTFSAEKVKFDYLHLIDSLTGDDVDLLSNPSYSFEAMTTDYVSRFRLVFSAGEEDGSSTPSTGSGTEGLGTFTY